MEQKKAIFLLVIEGEDYMSYMWNLDEKVDYALTWEDAEKMLAMKKPGFPQK